MTLVIHNCAQNSPEWLACRCGIPTASEFATVLAKGKGGGESVTRAKYLRTLAGQRITGEVVEGFANSHMERGHVMEAEARDLYALMKDADPEQIGFMRNGDVGASPDSLLGADGLLEIKTALPHIQIERLELNRVPPEHKAQVQGQLLVSERAYVDFVSYWPKLPLLVVREYRDEVYIAKLVEALDEFLSELNALVARIEAI